MECRALVAGKLTSSLQSRVGSRTLSEPQPVIVDEPIKMARRLGSTGGGQKAAARIEGDAAEGNCPKAKLLALGEPDDVLVGAEPRGPRHRK